MTINQSPGGEQIESGDIVQRFREHEADDCEWARDEVRLSDDLRATVKWAGIAFLVLLVAGLVAG